MIGLRYLPSRWLSARPLPRQDPLSCFPRCCCAARQRASLLLARLSARAQRNRARANPPLQTRERRALLDAPLKQGLALQARAHLENWPVRSEKSPCLPVTELGRTAIG